ncbi:hypothetical protein PHAVU_004G009401 [Phaseolus vulgaris]|uniref:RRM domain-containing protein n=1 Tax=Phaseolus vulgaris TaxID=3885 RepID=V7D2J6_PHAVU|nr:hypothetical protein PHAVU_L004200g [Phaseolus vulgaris]ESW35928.1 hypothetical protein PHAVU_L004200g [Phaseolus vulgaris]
MVSSFTTFFFSNFPNGYGEKDMFKIFQRWARVKEVYISHRLNKWGRRFGFVRLFDVKNVVKLEKELDQIYIGNRKLFVNIPKYRRHQEENNRVGEKETRPLNGRKKPEGNEESVSNKRKEVWVEKRGKKSFADVVRGQAQREWKGPGLKIQKQSLPWMENSVVGHFCAELDFEQLGEEFVRGGMNMVKVRSLGDNLALLTPREGESMKELVKLNKEWFDSIFISIKPWSTESVATHKVVWVRCFGLPISLWSKECFVRVLGEMANLISIDDATLSWENLEFARLKVRIACNRYVRVAKKVRINDHVASIYLEEEVPLTKVEVVRKSVTVELGRNNGQRERRSEEGRTTEERHRNQEPSLRNFRPAAVRVREKVIFG